jgi:hypothetical protein
MMVEMAMTLSSLSVLLNNFLLDIVEQKNLLLVEILKVTLLKKFGNLTMNSTDPAGMLDVDHLKTVIQIKSNIRVTYLQKRLKTVEEILLY